MSMAEQALGGYDPYAGLSAHEAGRPQFIPVPSLLRALLSEEVSRLTHFGLTDISIAILLAVFATILAGLYPTWRAAHVQPAWQLKAQ